MLCPSLKNSPFPVEPSINSYSHLTSTMTIAIGNLQSQQSCTALRSVLRCQSYDLWQKRFWNPRYKISLSNLGFAASCHDLDLRIGVHLDHQIGRKHNRSRVNCVQSCLAYKLQCLKSFPFCCTQGEFFRMTTSPFRARKKQNFLLVSTTCHNENFDNEARTERDGELEFCSKRSGSQKDSIETINESGYVIKVSKELMSVFQYVEKVKRGRLRELSETLRQVAYACLFFSCVKGIVTPLVEVFRTQPPSWGKLIMVLGAFDAFAITYLALKASEPLERLSSLATECQNENNMMGSIEKEEECILALAIDLVRLFRRLRNLALGTAVTQFAHILHTMLKLKKSYPNFASHIIKVVNTWLSTPWV